MALATLLSPSNNNIRFDPLVDVTTVWNFSNPSGYYLRLEYRDGSTVIKSFDVTTNTNYFAVITTSEAISLLATIPNSTLIPNITVRVYSYSDSGRTALVGSNDYTGKSLLAATASIRPTFTDYAIVNYDKSVAVVDKYANTLITSSTHTLTGSDDVIIKGISQIRASITTGNKMVALYSSTAVKYTLNNGSQSTDGAYSSGSTVDIDIDNATALSNFVVALDSRGLGTTVQKDFTVLSEYTPVILSTPVAARDNQIDKLVTLTFSGTFWKKYFSSNTTSNPSYGVLNAIVAEYRYKETTDTWASQTWHTISPSTTSGNISFSAHVNGDLGALGFDQDKSYNIEVRVYDKLSQQIVETTVSRGIPLMDFTREGVAVKAKYDDDKGGALQVFGQTFLSRFDGWNMVEEVFTYASADDPSFVAYASGDVTGKYSLGMKLSLVQTTRKYFILTKIGSYDSGNDRTPLTLYGGTDYDLANAAISDIYYSIEKSPLGFPLNPTKWTVIVSDTTNRSSSPVNDDWINLGSQQIDMPIGCWRVMYNLMPLAAGVTANSSTFIAIKVTLSNANNTEWDTELSCYCGGNNTLQVIETARVEKILSATSKTTLYLNSRRGTSATTAIYNYNDIIPAIISLECVYL